MCRLLLLQLLGWLPFAGALWRGSTSPLSWMKSARCPRWSMGRRPASGAALLIKIGLMCRLRLIIALGCTPTGNAFLLTWQQTQWFVKIADVTVCDAALLRKDFVWSTPLAT